MSLNFDFSKVADHRRVTTDPSNPNHWHPVADALVWLSMICGYKAITEANKAKVALRIAAYQVVAGSYLSQMVGGKTGIKQLIYITPDDVKRFVGMTTNASTMTDAQWVKRLGQIAMDHAGQSDHWTGRRDFPSALSILGEHDPINEAPAEPVAG